MATQTMGQTAAPVGWVGPISVVGLSGEVFYGNSPIAANAAGTVQNVSDTAGLKFIGFTVNIPLGPNSVTGNGTTSNLQYQPIQGGLGGAQFGDFTATGTAPVLGQTVFWSNADGDVPTVSGTTTNSINAGVVVGINSTLSTVTVRFVGAF